MDKINIESLVQTIKHKMKQRVVIEVPGLIPRLLTPNRSRKAHWGTITRVKNEFQTAVYYAALDAKNRWLKAHPGGGLPFEKGLLWYEMIIPDRRSIMDDDNAIAGLKYLRDVLQVDRAEDRFDRVGIIGNDANFRTARLTWTADKKQPPKIIVTVEED